MVACSLPDILRSVADTLLTLWFDRGILLSFAIRGLRFALDWQKSCYERNQLDSGRDRFDLVLASALWDCCASRWTNLR
jgi:hypothetical protein